MAETRTIKINVETNAKQTAQDFNAVSENATKAATSVESVGTAAAESGGKFQILNDIKNVVSNFVPAFKKAEGGVNAFSGSLKALLANPVVLIITAIVASLKFIYEAFQSNVKIGKEIAAVWEGLSAVGTQVKDAIFGLTRALVYAAEAAFKFITLDFKGASEAMKKANGEATTSFNQLTNAANGTTFAIVRGLEKQQQANNKAKKEQAVRESEINKLLVQSREILTDETASIKEKKKALEEVTRAEKASAAEKVRTAQIDLDILKRKAKALGGQAEIKMKQEIRDATIALNEAETENAMTGIKLNKQRKMLARQEKEENKAAIDAAKERIKAAQEARKEELKLRQEELAKLAEYNKAATDLFKSEYEKQKRDIEEKYAVQIALAKKYKQDTIDLEKARQKELDDLQARQVDLTRGGLDKVNALEIKSIKTTKDFQEQLKTGLVGVQEVRERIYQREKEIDEKKKKAQQDALESTANTLGGIAELFGKQTAAGKAAAIAQATIDTYLSAQKAYQATVGVPVVGPVLAPINAGIAIAAGIKNIKAITAVPTPNGGGGGGNVPSTNNFASATPAQAPSFNVVGNSGINQLAQLQQTPVQAYVVSGQVTTAQSLDRNRIDNATL